MYCSECGNRGIPVMRKSNKRREKGHLKKLWCCYCKKETNHVEITNNYTFEMFKFEFENYNFENGERKNTYKELSASLT